MLDFKSRKTTVKGKVPSDNSASDQAAKLQKAPCLEWVKKQTSAHRWHVRSAARSGLAAADRL
jgi:hypothetical protein